jgi:hypothetical protein
MQQQLADAPEVRNAVELMLEPRVEQPVAVRAAPTGVVTPSDILALAMQTGDKDVERLERLMGMEIRYREQQAIDRQREREWAEQDRIRDGILAFAEDFAKFRGENIIVPLTKHVDRAAAGSFEQAEYHRVAGMLSPALSKYGYGFWHDPKFVVRRIANIEGVERDMPWVEVTCYLEHRKGHSKSIFLEGPAGELRGNTLVQNQQATASFFKRQTLLAITGTATGGEDDEAKLGVRESAGDAATDAPTDIDAGQKITLRNAGEAAAQGGIASLTAWWAKLGPREQKDMSSHFSAMRKTARSADERGGK